MRNETKDKLYIIGPLNHVKQLSFAKMHVWIVIVNSETGACIPFCDLHTCIYFSFCHGWSDFSIKLHLHNVNIYQYVLYLKTNTIVNYK